MWVSKSNPRPMVPLWQGIRRLKSTLDDYQYWQVSKIPTMHFQASLPRLPIPKLAKTCERYLAAQKPLLIGESYEKTSTNVRRFQNTVGKDLQATLVQEDKKNKHTSYISEPWFDMYLKDRIPLPINYNPMIVLQYDKNIEYNEQILRATNMLISSLRFYRSLKDNVLEPEVYHLNPKKSDNETFRNICAKTPEMFAWYMAYFYKAFPLDMSQYKSLFGTTRIPEMEKDRLFQDASSKHILVLRRGRFYTFDVLDASGKILPPDLIYSRLKRVRALSEKAPCEYPIGVLTTLERDHWATIRHHLQGLNNERQLKLIDTAIFAICLDDDSVGLDPKGVTRQFLHGTGTNRWFDKSFSLLFSKDGVAAINFEHSWGDGVAVLRYVQDVFADSTNSPKVHPGAKSGADDVDGVEELEINLDDKIKQDISEAKGKYKKTCDSLDVDAIIFEGLGKRDCKKNAISPDAIMQLGFQVAYYRQSGKFVPSYESCSTAAFKHGRTEAIRPCTMATKTYSLASTSKTNRPSSAELMQMIKNCSEVHSKLTKEAAMGQGFDRHLFALKRIAERTGVACNIFDDPEYKNINHNMISTSTLSSPAVYAGGFGPVVKDGLGIAYVIQDNALGVLATSYPPNNNSSDFIGCLKTVFEEIREVFNNSK